MMKTSWGVTVNSFEGLEGSYAPCLEWFYKKGAKAWLLGPFSLHDKKVQEMVKSDDALKWLTELVPAPSLVIYMSFSSQAHVSDAQLNEMAFGLVESGHPFVWVVR